MWFLSLKIVPNKFPCTSGGHGMCQYCGFGCVHDGPDSEAAAEEEAREARLRISTEQWWHDAAVNGLPVFGGRSSDFRERALRNDFNADDF